MISHARGHTEQGFVLVVALCFVAAMAVLGATATVLTTTDMKIGSNYRESRRAYYNAEAGVQFAMGQILAGLRASPATFALPTGVGTSATLTGSEFTPPGQFAFSLPDPGLTRVAANRYQFTCIGTGDENATYTMQATFGVNRNHPFDYGIFGDQGVTLSGNGYSDSYNSTQGPYAGEGNGTNGDVGTNATSAGAISVGANAIVYGDAQVGPGGDPNTAITTNAHGEILGNRNVATDLKDMTPEPDPGGGTAATLSISGNTTQNIGAGSYRIPSLSISGNADAHITGNVTLYVTGNMSISGNGCLYVDPGASLTIYVAGTVLISGNGISNQTNLPGNAKIFGGATCNSVQITGNGNLYASIYAPVAPITVTGNGDVYGSLVGRTIGITGNGNVHYDEALGVWESQAGPPTGLSLTACK